MFDVHYHLLYGVDDGPRSIEESVAMAEASIAEGVTHILCTPHLNLTYQLQPEANQDALDLIREHVGERLTLSTGCEFHLTYEHMEMLRQDPQRYAMNRGRYLLVELSDFGVSPHIEGWFEDIQSLGLTPIVAHPERNPLLQLAVDRLAEWVSSGVLLQITAGSLWGRFGGDANSAANQLLKKDLVHLVASDAHGVSKRGPSMRRVYDLLVGRFGEAIGRRLCAENPRSIFFGEPLAAPAKAAEKSEMRSPTRIFAQLLRSKPKTIRTTKFDTIP